MKSIKKSWIVIGIIIILILIGYSSIKGTYNSMNAASKEVDARWAQVENVYQRRADLIPNLVSTVKGYADFEQKTLTDVIEARSKATAVSIDPTNLDANNLQQFEAAQQGLSSALARLMVVVERYPDLKANQNFLELQTQLEGTENRIAVERRNYIEATKNYNTLITNFPQVFFAGVLGFKEKPTFSAKPGADEAPNVSDQLNQ